MARQGKKSTDRFLAKPVYVRINDPKVNVAPIEDAVRSKSGALAVGRGSAHWGKKWVLVHVRLGLTMGEYFGHFDSRAKAVAFMTMLDKLWQEAGPGVMMPKAFFVWWNKTCKEFGRPGYSEKEFKQNIGSEVLDS